jgi:hypothetical protein
VNKFLVVLGLLAVVTLPGCAHGRRMAEVNAFEAGYFTLLVRGAYDEAYGRLHSEVKARVTPEQYEAFFGALTSAFGAAAFWEKVPGANDQHVPLFERERRRDPLPPENPAATLQSRYLVRFATGTTTFLIKTGREEGRMVIRGQLLCCMDQKTWDTLLTHAKERGVAEFLGSAPPAKTP